MKKLFVAVLAVVLVSAAVPAVRAKDAFTNHVDLFNAISSNDKVVLGDFGYHFTTFHVAKRVELLGAGLMLDPKNLFEDSAGRSARVNLLLVAPIFEVALASPEKDRRGTDCDCWVSLGARYGYNLSTRDHALIAGFSVSFR